MKRHRMMTGWGIGLILAMATGTVAETAARPAEMPWSRALLQDAFQKTEALDYCTEIEGVARDKEGVHRTIRYYRHTGEDGVVYRRAEIIRNGAAEEVYIANASGQYGVIDEYRGRIGETFILFDLDFLHLPIDSMELSNSVYEVADGTYNGIPCYELRMKVGPSDLLLADISGKPFLEVQDVHGEFRRVRPFVRVFWIGKEDHIIYARKHYNALGKLLIAQELGTVLPEDSGNMDLYETPSGIQESFYFRPDFRMWAAARRELAARPIQDPLESLLEKTGRWGRRWISWDTLLRYGPAFFGSVALVLLLGLGGRLLWLRLNPGK